MKNSLRVASVWALLGNVLGLFLWLAIGDEFEVASELGHTYARKQALLERLEELPEQEQQIKRQLADLGNAEAARYLYQGDHNTVQSLIQKDIRQLASQSKVVVNRMRSLGEATDSGLLAPAAIQLDLVTGHVNLMDFLASLEVRQPLLRIRRLRVRVDRASTETQAARLSVSAEIQGFRESADRGQP